MARMRRADSKRAIGRQRAQLKQRSRHKRFVGQDAGEQSGRASELEKVRHMQQEAAQHAAIQPARAPWAEYEQGWENLQHRAAERARREPLSAIVADLVADSVRLARTLIAFPFRVAAALRGHAPSHA